MEASARGVAQRVSRRSFVATITGLLFGGAALPLLPVARGAAAGSQEGPPDESRMEGDTGDPTSCNYWRHCAIDGFLCSCCGGSPTQCPPGTEMAKLTWIGTCTNPVDGRNYLVSYNDCCGKSSCGRCFCNRNEGERPMYFPPKNNDTNWCQGTQSIAYHCTIAAVVGVAVDEAATNP
jgi:methylamine dehydrogenase light chain